MKRKVTLYRELLATAWRTLRCAPAALAAVEGRDEPWLRQWRAEVAHYRNLVEPVVRQTVRRVLEGETVPAEEKVVSLFEPHTDIIRKGGRRVQYGHKVNLCSGRSGLVPAAVVEAGNPPDSPRCLPMIERHSEFYESPPERWRATAATPARRTWRRRRPCGCVTWSSTRRRASEPRITGPSRSRSASWLPEHMRPTNEDLWLGQMALPFPSRLALPARRHAALPTLSNDSYPTTNSYI